MYVDTHLHLASESDENIKNIVEDASASGDKYLFISGTNVFDNEKNIEIASLYDNIFVCIGYHPSEINDIGISYLQGLEKYVFNKKVVAIGEIGLDYFYGKETKFEQISLFESQLKFAQNHNLPVIIHSRDATSDTINILKKYKLRGIIHCFSGSLEIALEYIKLGYYLGVGGVLTFKNSNLKEVIKDIPLENIVLETDSPFLSPYRGEKNEPKNIEVIAQTLADIKNVSLEEVAFVTTNNAFSLFDLNIRLWYYFIVEVS